MSFLLKKNMLSVAKKFSSSIPSLAIMVCCISEPLLSLDEEEKFSKVSAQMTDQLELLISPEEISEKVKEIALKINDDYQGKDLVVVMLMKGAICIASDLIRAVDIPLTLDYIKASSYGANGLMSGELTIAGFEKLNLEGKDVLVVDDIFDTGKTMTAVLARLQEKNPNSLKSLVLLVKKVDRQTSYLPEYVLFDIEDRFVVGYGLDYNEQYRQLPGIYVVK